MSDERVSECVRAEASSVELDDPVRRTVLQLNALCKSTTLQFTLAVGELVLKGVYSGNLSRLRSRRRKDHAALRRVAEDPDLAMSASALYRSVAIFEVCERLKFRCWKHVSTSHIRLVLALPTQEQERLLREAEANRWAVREFERFVSATAKVCPAVPSRGGRKRRTHVRSMIDGLRKGTDHIAGLLAQGEDILEDASPGSVRAAVEALEGMKSACAEMAERVAMASSQSGIRLSDGRLGPEDSARRLREVD